MMSGNQATRLLSVEQLNALVTRAENSQRALELYEVIQNSMPRRYRSEVISHLADAADALPAMLMEINKLRSIIAETTDYIAGYLEEFVDRKDTTKEMRSEVVVLTSTIMGIIKHEMGWKEGGESGK